jgi:hypothetical protein
MHSIRGAACALLLVLLATNGRAQSDAGDAYLKWSRQQAETIGRATRVDGRVGGAFDLRVIRTERSYNYKLRATLMTPDVIRASARLMQLADALTDDQAAALVKDAEQAGDLVVMFEVDPREGSGVIPLDMVVLLRPKGAEEPALRGTLTPALRNARALAGAYRRDYAYEQFWAVFRLDDRARAIFGPSVSEMEFVVRIYDKEGRVSWRIPDTLRAAAGTAR